MFKVVVGHSDEVDTDDAIDEVLARCDDQLGDLRPDAGLVFCGTDYDRGRLLERITSRYPGLQLVGCTTDGEMSSEIGFTEDAINLVLFCSDEIEFGAGIGERAGEDPERAARDAVAMAAARLELRPRLAITMPDGLTSSAFHILDGIGAALGHQVPVVGGMSADRVGGEKSEYATYQFCGDRVCTDAVPVLLFGGRLLYSLGVESGWSPLGKRMQVTRAEGVVLQELDGRPALELYSHYLGELGAESLTGLGAYPLAVYEQGLDRYYLRVASRADPDTGSITFLGEIPVGAEVQITQAIRDEVIAGVQRSVGSALADYPGERPQVAMLFSCTGRKLALGTRTRDEIGHAVDALGLPLPMCGFYTFGEIGPLSESGDSRYHNTTFVTLLMGAH